MLCLTRHSGTSLEFTIKPSDQPRKMTIEFHDNGAIKIDADRSIGITRDDAIVKEEKPCL